MWDSARLKNKTNKNSKKKTHTQNKQQIENKSFSNKWKFGKDFFFLKTLPNVCDIIIMMKNSTQKATKKILWSSDGNYYFKYLLHALQLNALQLKCNWTQQIYIFLISIIYQALQ